MGIDARMIAIWDTDRTEEQRDTIEDVFRMLQTEKPVWLENNCLKSTFGLQRYYGPSYTRAYHYPIQASCMFALIACGARVYYGGDSYEMLGRYRLEQLEASMKYFMQYRTQAYSDKDKGAPDMELPSPTDWVDWYYPLGRRREEEP